MFMIQHSMSSLMMSRNTINLHVHATTAAAAAAVLSNARDYSLRPGPANSASTHQFRSTVSNGSMLAPRRAEYAALDVVAALEILIIVYLVGDVTTNTKHRHRYQGSYGNDDGH